MATKRQRFQSPWQQNGIGHEAEQIVLRIAAYLGVAAVKASDFEDCILKCDLWLECQGCKVPIQLSVSEDEGVWAGKAYECRREGVIPVYVPFRCLQQADPKSECFEEFALEQVVKEIISQIRMFQQSFRGQLLTPAISIAKEKEWISRTGRTTLPVRQPVAA